MKKPPEGGFFVQPETDYLLAGAAAEAAGAAPEAAPEAASAAGAAGAAAGAGAGAGSSFLPQAASAKAAITDARTSDFFISGSY